MTAPQPSHRFAHHAMNTTFELLVRGVEEGYAKEAARAAFVELERVEKELSRYIEYSDVAQINRLRVGESARVGVATWECLRLAQQMFEETNGAFDVTIGALKDRWQGHSTKTALAAARALTGMHLLKINEAEHTVAVTVNGVLVDLGAIGKGYAVDQMVALLREWSIEDALVHSGQSTAFAIGSWQVAIRDPLQENHVLGHVHLCERALSGSGLSIHGLHIIDPRTGHPTQDKRGAWAIAPSAALSDALATAFMVMSPEEIEGYCRSHADVAAMIVTGAPDNYAIKRFGSWEIGA